MQKLQAYQILKLNEGASEMEIKKNYRKLSLWYHPEKNSNSEENRKKHQEIQAAYERLISELPINYKVNFGVSETEIEEFKKTCGRELDEFVEQTDTRELFFSLEIAKTKFNSIDTEEVLLYSTPEQSKIYRNWLNHLYWMHSLGQDEKLYNWVENNFNAILLTNSKKDVWEEVQKKFKNSFSELEWSEQLQKLQAAKNVDEIWVFKTQLFKVESKKTLSKEIEKSSNPQLLNDIINIEVDMHSFDSLLDNFPPYDGKNVDYWADWMNTADKISDVEDRKYFITQFLKNYNNKEVLLRAAANQYYDILGFAGEVSLEEVKKRYKELSLLHHPDKGERDPEKFKLINKANRVLGSEVKKIKYDLCLQEDEDSENLEYLNRKKLSKIKRAQELVDEEFGKKIELILQDELGLNNLTWEELNDYGEGRWNEKEYSKFQKLNGAEIELVKVEDFYRHVLFGTRQDEAIEHTKKYLKIFVAASILKEEIKKAHEKTSGTPFADGVRKRLTSSEPTLIEEELDKEGKENQIKKIERIEIKIKLAEIRKEKEEKIAGLKRKLKVSFQEVCSTIEQIREAKRKLLMRLSEKIVAGQTLLSSATDQETITNFQTEFDTFLTFFKEKESREEEVKIVISGVKVSRKVTVNEEVIKQVFLQKQVEINSLKEQLENFAEKEGLEAKNSIASASEESISETEKEEFIKYLDNLILDSVFEDVKRKGLKIAQKTVFAGEEIDYSAKIKKVDNKQAAETVRNRIVDEVFYYVNDLKGGSGEKEKAKEILNNFALILQEEIREKLGTELSVEQQKQLEINWVADTNSSAKKLAESKWKILNKANLKKPEVEEVPKEIFSTNDSLSDETGENAENFKSVEKELIVKNLQDEAITKVNNYWNSQQTEGKINGKTQEQIFTTPEWQENIKNKNASDSIKTEKERLIELIIVAKSEEITEQKRLRAEELAREREELKKSNESYDNLLTEIQNATFETINTFGERIKIFSNISLSGERSRVNLEKILTEQQQKIVADEAKKQIEKEKNMAIQLVDDYWTEKIGAANGNIDGRIKAKVLTTGWQNGIRILDTKEKIDAEKERLIRLIDTKVQQVAWQNDAITNIQKYWNENITVDNKINGQIITEILENENWQIEIKELINQIDIENKQKNYIKKIISAKKIDVKLQTLAIERINEHWDSNQTKINDQSKEKVLNAKLTSPNTWEKDIQNQTGPTDIINKEKYYQELIDIQIKESEQSQEDDWQNIIPGEAELNDKLKNLWQEGWSSLARTLTFREIPIKKWFDRLIEFLDKDNNLKEIYGKVSKDKKSKIISVLKQEKDEINSKEEFENNFYFKEIIWEKGNEIRQYLRMIIKTIDEQDAKEKREKEARQARQESIKEVSEFWKQAHFFTIPNQSAILGTNDLKKIFAGLVEKEKIETLKKKLVNKIVIEETNQFLKKSLVITGFEEVEINNCNFFVELSKKGSREETINFRDLIFTEIVGKGIDKALRQENPHVPYDKLTNNPKEDILQKDKIQDKIEALKLVLSEIKENRREIRAENALQELIEKKIPNDYGKLKQDLKNLQRIIPRNNELLEKITEEKDDGGKDIRLSEAQIKVYQEKKDSADKKELELIRALALFEDDERNSWQIINPCDLTEQEKKYLKGVTKTNIQQVKNNIRQGRRTRWNTTKERVQSSFETLHETIIGNSQKDIEDAERKIEKNRGGTSEEKMALIEAEKLTENIDWKNRARNRVDELKEEINRWEKMKTSIETEEDLTKLGIGAYWHHKIHHSLDKSKLPNDKQPPFLETQRQIREKKIRKYNDLIREIDEANNWKKLKIVYEKGFHGEFEQRLSTAFNNKNLQNLIEQETEIIIQLIKNCTDENTDELTKRINELETDLETHELKLPADKEIKKLKYLLDNQKEKLVFREKFRKQVGESITISDDTIDPYFNKGLVPEKMADAYSHHNIYQRISAAEIVNRRVFFARKIYNLYEEEGLKNLQEDKIFVYDFRNQGNFSSRLTAEEILTYRKVSSNQKYWITGQQAFNACQKGWIQPDQIRISDNNQKQINLGTGWKDYDWEQYLFNEVKDKELNSLQTQIEIPPK